MPKNNLIVFDDWRFRHMDELLEDYHFDINMIINDNNFDEEQADKIITFKEFCLSKYLSYIDEIVYE
jgi:hypothetical protein